MEIEKNQEIVRESYQPNDFIFFEGDLDRHFYIVESGQVRILSKNKQGHNVELNTIDPGESFGEFAFLDQKPRSASAQALTQCVVIRVSEKGYEQLLEELPTWASCMLRSFARRIVHMNELL